MVEGGGVEWMGERGYVRGGHEQGSRGWPPSRGRGYRGVVEAWGGGC